MGEGDQISGGLGKVLAVRVFCCPQRMNILRVLRLFYGNILQFVYRGLTLLISN